MRELAGVGRDAGPGRWLAAVAGAIAGLGEAAVLVLTVAAAVALSDGAVEVPDLPLGIAERSAGSLVALGFGCALVRIAASLVGLWLSTAAKTSAEARYQRDLFAAYLRAPWEAMTGITEGRLQELASGQALLAATAVQHLTRAIQHGLSFAVLVAIGVAVDPASAVLSLLGASVMTVLLRPVVRAAAQRARRRLSHDLDVATITAETVRLGEELSAFGVGDVQAARAGEMIDAKRRAGASAEFTAELMPVAYQGAVFIVIFLGLGLLVVVGATVGPELAAVLLLLLRAFAYSQLAQSAYTAARVAAPRREAVLEATRLLAAARPEPAGRTLGPISSFELVHVTYDYPDGRRALDGIDLRIEPGEALGISGPSGAGKSTLVQLLLRLRAPTSGALLVDGLPAAAFDPASWATQVALVPQEPKLFDGTVAENIRFLREGITDDQVAEAARLAGLDGELGPERFERRVGPRDRALSGGQRQRLAIARALAGEPSLLVLDEPTSALDVECERVIQETLVSLKGDVTIVVVTHRPTTLQRCDRVVSLRDGRIEAEGPPLPRTARPR